MSYSYIVYVTDLSLQCSYKLQKVSVNKSFIHSFTLTLTCVNLQMFFQIWWVLKALVTLTTNPWTITQLSLACRVPCSSHGFCNWPQNKLTQADGIFINVLNLLKFNMDTCIPDAFLPIFCRTEKIIHCNLFLIFGDHFLYSHETNNWSSSILYTLHCSRPMNHLDYSPSAN